MPESNDPDSDLIWEMPPDLLDSPKLKKPWKVSTMFMLDTLDMMRFNDYLAAHQIKKGAFVKKLVLDELHYWDGLGKRVNKF